MGDLHPRRVSARLSSYLAEVVNSCHAQPGSDQTSDTVVVRGGKKHARCGWFCCLS